MKKEFIKHVETRGTVHQLSFPRKPEHNGVVERKHPHM